MKKLLAALVLLAMSVLPAFAQNGANVRQSGNVTPGHVPMWTTSGAIQDGGTAAQGFLTSLGVTNNGGPGICINSAPITQPYNRLCLSASTSGSSTLSLQNLGGATAQTFAINVNGVNYPFPGAGTGFATGPGCIPIGTGNADEFLSDCTTATGTGNAIILTPTLGPIPTTLQLVLFTRYTFQAAASNSGPTTIRMGASGPGPYNVYTNSGVALAGGEIIVGSWYTMGFDPALNSNAGGWRIIVGFEASGTGVTFVQGGTGAATRTMQGKVRESVSVLDYTNTGLAAVCGGVDAVDDSIAINKAIAYVGANGGGDVLFPPFTDCRIKNPINAVASVHLVGQGGINGTPGAASIIYPSANLSAMVLQPDLTTPMSDFGIIGMTLNGRKGSFTVGNIVRVSGINSHIRNSVISNGSGNCIQWDTNAIVAWVNWIESSSIGSCDAFGISFSGSDSWITNNELGGAGQANIYIAGAGAMVISNNKIETASSGQGIVIQTPSDHCTNNRTANVITSNIIEMNGEGVYFKKGTCPGSASSSDIVSGNVFIGNSLRDIHVEDLIVNGHIGPNNHTSSDPSGSYLGFISAVTANTGWTFEGTVGTSTLTENAPVDLRVDISGSQKLFRRTSVAVTGSTSGVVTQVARAVAGTPTITWGTSSGTPAVTPTSPLAIDATTGNITCTGCLTNTPAALTKTDDTNVTLTLGGTPATALLQATSLTLGWTGQLSVARGGTGLASGTSGGVLAFTASGTLALSVALTANQLVTGGGAGAAPTPLGSLGTTTTLLHGNAGGAPTFGAVVSADMNITTTSCTNQFVTAISAGGVGTCTTDTLAGAQHANQGTTTTVLHGNAAGNPSWAAVSLSADVTGNLPNANLASQTANTVLGALTATTPSGLAVPSCSTAGSALLWTSGSGFSCNTSINATNAVNANITNVTSGATGFPTWVAVNATNQPLNVTSTQYTYNPSTNILGVGQLSLTNTADFLDVGSWNMGISAGSLLWFNGGNQMVLTSGGALTLAGNITAVLGSDTAQTDSTVCINSSNVFLKGTGTLGICLGTSGRQFKTSEAPMTAGVNEISRLKLLNYRYKPGYGDGGERIQYGLVAQDVEQVMPDLVRHGPDGETINFDIGALLPVALRAIQELKADNDNLKKEVNKLKRRAAR